MGKYYSKDIKAALRKAYPESTHVFVTGPGNYEVCKEVGDKIYEQLYVLDYRNVYPYMQSKGY